MPSTTPTSSRSVPGRSSGVWSSDAEGRRRIAVVGGGSGLSVLLRGLKRETDEDDILTAIVTMADDGGSSGRLRREFGVQPPGDVRNCLVALADDEDLVARLFQYRFPKGSGLSGHSFGNLFLAALTDITGDFSRAVLTAESILSVRGRILPATVDDVRLAATGVSGREYAGESAIGLCSERLETLRLEPRDVTAFPEALEALREADLILLGPGSLYTSILPNLLIPEIRQAVTESHAPVVLILNLMTQPGETDAMTAFDHVRALRRHTGCDLVDTLLANSTQPPAAYLEEYARAGAELVRIDHDGLQAMDLDILEADLLADDELIRHDPRKLARAALDLLALPAMETSAGATR